MSTSYQRFTDLALDNLDSLLTYHEQHDNMPNVLDVASQCAAWLKGRSATVQQQRRFTLLTDDGQRQWDAAGRF